MQHLAPGRDPPVEGVRVQREAGDVGEQRREVVLPRGEVACRVEFNVKTFRPLKYMPLLTMVKRFSSQTLSNFTEFGVPGQQSVLGPRAECSSSSTSATAATFPLL